METIELVIRLPKKVYDTVMKKERMLIEDDIEIYKAIDNGIPLPKGHGRLIDESKIDWLESSGDRFTFEKRIKNTSETIVEADEEGEEENEDLHKRANNRT